MDFVSPILTILTDLFHFTSKCASPICDLRENLECMRGKMQLLNLRSQDVKTRVELANQQHMTPTREVGGWLEDVGEEKKEVDAILKEGDELLPKKCLGRCRNIRLSHDLGNRVRRKISRVENLTSRGVFDVVAYRSLPAAVQLPLGNTVGLDSMYERVCRLLTENEARIVGLYGKQGIGKTTLMKKINNGLLKTSHDFDVVIWVEVSQEASVRDAQQVIGNRLQIIDSMWQNRNQQERAIEIFNVMKRIRFLLLLDNVQKPLDLSEIGVPPHVYKSKVIIATRTISSIFNEMQVNRQLEVGPLAPTEAWALFIMLIGKNIIYPEQMQFARNILTKCEGLPSAIVMAGRQFAARQLAARSVWEWEQLTPELEYLIREEISGKDRLPQAVGEVMPLEQTVGLGSLYEKVCSFLAEDEVGIIGIYGRRGIGKTTLMKKFNNYFLQTRCHFDTVIWVPLRKRASAGAVQHVIGNKLQIIDSIWQNSSQDERGTQIYKIMREKRFLLLLDNVEQPLDLSNIGVPTPDAGNMSKVIINTRTSRIFSEMKVNRRLEVGHLAPTEALTLFIEVMGEDVPNYTFQMQDFIDKISLKCQGLPSAIIMAARKLAGCDVGKWEQLKQELEDPIEEISEEDRFHPAVVEMPLGHTVGLDSLYDRVCNCLTQYPSASIGLYGTGGVGKTTLMKKVNNEFLKTSYLFDLVIWVSFSKQVCVRAAQEVIRNKLQIPDNMWQNRDEHERAEEISKIMRKKRRFVLLLDDEWEGFDLIKIGVPPLREIPNGSKAIITTRFEDLCLRMGVPRDKQFRVEVLAREQALTLFHEKVGREILNSHTDIPQLSEILADRCKGLPLALVIVGQAMATKKSPEAWDQAIKELDKFLAEIEDTKHGLFHVLKLSYDSLREDITKFCFIYRSFFPKEYEITIDDLIEHWIGEGFFYGKDINEARRLGHEIIEHLRNACLLENGDGFNGCIKMHDVIHDMARWIAQDCGQNMNKIWVCESHGPFECERVTKWEEAERISLWGRSIVKLPESPTCSNLRTLLVRECIELKTLPRKFFQSMPLLRVLDLSASHCLCTLPDGVKTLINLEYINLSMTNISALPTGISQMKKLRCLLLDGLDPLIIHPDLISGLSSLQLFSMYDGDALSVHRTYLLEELESIKPLDDLSLSFRSGEALDKLLTSYKLQGCIRRLSLRDCKDLILHKLSSNYLKNLETVMIFSCPNLGDTKINVEKEGSKGFERSYGNPNPELIVRNEQYFLRLRHVKIWSCPKLLNLTWLIYAVYLQSLNVQCCESMTEVISSECLSSSTEHASIFTRLTSLVLGGIPALTSIYHGALHLSSLEVITVINIPSLRRLPLNSNSAINNLKNIEGDLTWWKSLEWEDGSEAKFAIYFSAQYLADPIHHSGEMKGKNILVGVEGGSTSGEAT